MISNEKRKNRQKVKSGKSVKPVVIMNIVQVIMEQINAQDIFKEMIYGIIKKVLLIENLFKLYFITSLLNN